MKLRQSGFWSVMAISFLIFLAVQLDLQRPLLLDMRIVSYRKAELLPLESEKIMVVNYSVY